MIVVRSHRLDQRRQVCECEAVHAALGRDEDRLLLIDRQRQQPGAPGGLTGIARWHEHRQLASADDPGTWIWIPRDHFHGVGFALGAPVLLEVVAKQLPTRWIHGADGRDVGLAWIILRHHLHVPLRITQLLGKPSRAWHSIRLGQEPGPVHLHNGLAGPRIGASDFEVGVRVQTSIAPDVLIGDIPKYLSYEECVLAFRPGDLGGGLSRGACRGWLGRVGDADESAGKQRTATELALKLGDRCRSGGSGLSRRGRRS